MFAGDETVQKESSQVQIEEKFRVNVIDSIQNSLNSFNKVGSSVQILLPKGLDRKKADKIIQDSLSLFKLENSTNIQFYSDSVVIDFLTPEQQEPLSHEAQFSIDWNAKKRDNFLRHAQRNIYKSETMYSYIPIKQGDELKIYDGGGIVRTVVADLALSLSKCYTIKYVKTGTDEGGRPIYEIDKTGFTTIDNTSMYSIPNIIKQGTNEFVSQLGPDPDDEQLIHLANSISRNFSSWVLFGSDEQTLDENDYVNKGRASNIILQGVESSDLSKGAKERLTALLKEKFNLALKEQRVADEQSFPAQFRSRDAYIAYSNIMEQIFPQTQLASLPHSGLSNHILDEHKKISEEVIDLVNFLDQISGPQTTATLYNLEFGNIYAHEFAQAPLMLQWSKIGLTNDGSPFLLIDKQAHDAFKAWHLEHNTDAAFPNYVVTEKPPDSKILYDCSLEDGEWARKSNFRPDDHTFFSDMFKPDRQHFGYLFSQSHFLENGIENDMQKKLVQNSGTYKDYQSMLDDEAVFIPQIHDAITLLEEGEGKMDRIWFSSTPFYSFSDHNIQNHHLVFGEKDGEIFVVDAQNKVRGSAENQIDAIEDMAKSGYCTPGIYYPINKRFGVVDNTPDFEQIVAIPQEDSWIYTTLDYTSHTLTAGYLIPTPYTQAAGIVGSLIRAGMDEYERSDRAFHKGEEFRWGDSDGYYLAAELCFVAGAAVGLGRFKFLTSLPTLTKSVHIAGGVGFVGFMGAGMKKDFQVAAQKQVDIQNGVGQNISTSQDYSDDLFGLDQQLLTVASLAKTGDEMLIGDPDSEMALDYIKNYWVPQILAAYKSQIPLGLEGQEVAVFESLTLERNLSWVLDNWDSMGDISKLCGLDLESTVLEILMFGGPKIEGSEAGTLKQIKVMSNIQPELFLDAAKSLYKKMHEKGLDVSEQRVFEDLQYLWLRGKIGLDYIQKLD